MAKIATRPLPHHFAGEWGPNQVADLEEDLIVVAEDLGLVAAFAQGVSDRVDALVAAPKLAGVGPPGGAFWGSGGEDGADGFPGVLGPMGPMGLIGLRGFDGADGEDGAAWPGPQGAPGLDGVTATSAPTTTGTETALAIPTGTGDLMIVLNNATLLTVQGITAGLDGQLLFIFSKGAGQVDFAHLHASGTALGKLKLFATSGLTSLAAGSGAAVFQYDATVTQWRLVAHVQGAAIVVPYAAGDFTAGGVGASWTVDSGDVLQFTSVLTGRILTVFAILNNTTTGVTPSDLRILIPAGFVANRTTLSTAGFFYNSTLGIGEACLASVQTAGTQLIFYRLSFAVFPSLVNLADLDFQLTFEVQ